jgi:hypothetical protein
MKQDQKIKLFYFLGFLLVFLIVWSILHWSFPNLEAAYKGMISAGVAAIFSPRISEYESQSGKKMQIKWLFFKKIIKP